MHHAAQRYAFPDFASLGGGEQEEPPWTAEVRAGGRTLPDERVRELFHAPWPLPWGRESHDLTAAATAQSGVTVPSHLPGSRL